MSNLFISPSLYSLFLYVLINDDWKNSDFVLTDRIPLVIHRKLKASNINVFTYYSCKKKTLLGKIFFKLYDNVVYWKYLWYSRDKHYNDIYGNDEIVLSFKYRNKGIRLIEDGPFNNKPISFFKKRQIRQEGAFLNYWIYWFFRKYIPYGYDDKVNIIYHTENIILPNKLENKGRLIDIKQIWNSKTEQKRIEILNLFNISPDIISTINNYSTVLVTQMLPISDNEKIKIYKNMIVANGVDESSLLIKTHYAEDIDYHKIFPKALIIDMPVPFQLFELLGYSPKNVLTICSSAVFRFATSHTNIVFLGTEFNQRLLDAYGIVRLEDFINK